MRAAPSSALRTTVLALAMAAAWGIAGCTRSGETPASAPAAELPDQEVTDFVISETDTGRVEWKLYAQNAAIYNVRSTVVARAIRVDFYDELGKRTSTLTAREGELNQVRKDMVARGDVVVQTAEGTRMTTQAMRFDNQRRLITSDLLVRVEKDGNVLSGYGFESDPNLQHYEFKHEVHATVRTASGGIMEAQKAPPKAGPPSAAPTKRSDAPQPRFR